MTQANVKLTTFEEYLSYSDAVAIEGRYELIDPVAQKVMVLA